MEKIEMVAEHSRGKDKERKSETKKEPARTYTAQDRCKTVLSVWTERRKTTEVCRELMIPYAMLSSWQNRALEGMLQALEPRVNLEQCPALSPRLSKLIEKRYAKLGRPVSADKLEARLLRVQEMRTGRKDEGTVKEDKKP